MKYLLYISITVLLLSSCKTLNSQATTSRTYKVYLYFYSIGAGTADAGPVTGYIREFKAANGIASVKADKIGPLGKEGEYALGFELKEMNAGQQASFISGITQKAKSIKDRGASVNVETNYSIRTDSLPFRATIETVNY